MGALPGCVAAKEVLKELKNKYHSGIGKIFADGGFLKDLADWVKMQLGFEIIVVKRNEKHKCKVLPMRWIVERTLAWLTFHRRMSKNYKHLSDSGVAFIQLAMVRLMLNKIYQ